ncbi:condensation domain-containing protein [Actinomycetes bacterium NPDC127524]
MSGIVSETEKKIIHSSLESKHSYNIPLFVKFETGMDLVKMYGILNRYFEKFSIFRTYFQIDSEIKRCTGMDAPMIEIRKYAIFDKDEVCKENLVTIEDRVLVRVVLCKVLNEPYDYLFFNIHHVLLDGFSVNQFLREVITEYLGDEKNGSNLYDAPESGIEEKAGYSNVKTDHEEIVFTGYESFRKNLEAKQEDQTNNLEEKYVLSERTGKKYSDFSVLLTALTCSLAQWLKSPSVYLSYPFLGRDQSNFRMLGNFVQLIPFYQEMPLQDINAEEMILSNQRKIFSSFSKRNYYQEIKNTSRMDRLNIFTDIVFDYKSGSLIEKRLSEKPPIILEESDLYLDDKYGLHFVVYQEGKELTINIISGKYQRNELEELLVLFKRMVQVLYDNEKIPVSEMFHFTISEEKQKEEQANANDEQHALDQERIYRQVTGMVSFLLNEGQTIGKDESFFDLGMDSLLLVKFKKNIKQAFNMNLKISDFFTNYTAEMLTKKIMDNLGEAKKI